MFEAVEELIGEHADLEKKLADPSVHADQANARKLNKRYAELTPIVSTYRSWKQTGEDIETAREFAADDPDFAAEVKELEKQREETTERLRLLLVPRDPSDDKDVLLEIKAGAGGDESALFMRLTTCCACTCATPSASAGRPRSSTPPSPSSAATRTSRSP